MRATAGADLQLGHEVEGVAVEPVLDDLAVGHTQDVGAVVRHGGADRRPGTGHPAVRSEPVATHRTTT